MQQIYKHWQRPCNDLFTRCVSQKKEAMNLPNYIRRITICGVLLFTGASSLHAQFPGPVNAIIGDESFELMYHGSEPGEADEQLRIQTHLAFVESKLRSAATNHLNDDQIRNRRFIIDLLHNYWQAGQFPSNSAYAERRPCFIDDEGNICAVGYLLAASRGWDVAASINERFQYEYLTDMDEPLLAEWANNYGLSLEECAMIQPTYGPPPAPVISYAELKPGYGISSSVMSGVNLAGNILMLSKKTTGKGLAKFGIATGGAQLIMGIANIKKERYTIGLNGASGYTRYRAQNNLSYLNIAMGTTTLVTSTLNLLMHAKKDRNSPLSFYSYPNEANSISMGLHFSHRF